MYNRSVRKCIHSYLQRNTRATRIPMASSSFSSSACVCVCVWWYSRNTYVSPCRAKLMHLKRLLRLERLREYGGWNSFVLCYGDNPVFTYIDLSPVTRIPTMTTTATDVSKVSEVNYEHTRQNWRRMTCRAGRCQSNRKFVLPLHNSSKGFLAYMVLFNNKIACTYLYERFATHTKPNYAQKQHARNLINSTHNRTTRAESAHGHHY